MSTTSSNAVPGSIPDRLRARIEEAYGGNQRAFATAMGLSPQHVSAMLSGKIALPRPDVRRMLARELGMTHGEFLVLAGELDANEIVIQHRPLPSDEAEIVRLYRDLPLATRKALLAIARELAHQFAQEADSVPDARPGPDNGTGRNGSVPVAASRDAGRVSSHAARMAPAHNGARPAAHAAPIRVGSVAAKRRQR
ncbi:MAG TPA: helix-turn-helix transcriptional regulator [Thermomicrobiales bacterium]|jgi:transcriptional regulator with XRE-family HTH domain|nr:helix-turn-helix transcriptional regulator [Thermomicrobiales bacterium]